MNLLRKKHHETPTAAVLSSKVPYEAVATDLEPPSGAMLHNMIYQLAPAIA
jgi:hypothetical protein